MDPAFAIAHLLLYRARIVVGDLEGGLAAHRVYASLNGRDAADVEVVIRAIQGRGDRARALAVFSEWERTPARLGDAVLLGPLLGETDRVLSLIERAIEWRHPLLGSLGTPAWAAPLRDQPRFERLIARMEFPRR